MKRRLLTIKYFKLPLYGFGNDDYIQFYAQECNDILICIKSETDILGVSYWHTHLSEPGKGLGTQAKPDKH